MTTFFTSDTHFNHVSIRTYCPGRLVLGDSLEETNENLIKRWNEVVTPDDTVYHLGDFAMGPKVLHKSFLDRLNGTKLLVRGNHDQPAAKMLAMGFKEVTNRLFLPPMDTQGLTTYLAHIPVGADVYKDRYYPPELIEEPKYYDIWLHGHVHDKFKRRGKYINVGCDVWDFRPVTLDQLLAARDGT